MSAWIPISEWPSCAQLEKPGIVFEIVNAEGQQLITRCVVPLPAMPWDWKSPPLRFRAIAEPKPVRSAPIPEEKR